MSWTILILGIVAGVTLQSRLCFLAPLAALLARRLAGLTSISRPGDIRAGVVIIFALLCMWVDLLFHVPGWLRSAAQIAFITALLIAVVAWLFHDIRILSTPAAKENA